MLIQASQMLHGTVRQMGAQAPLTMVKDLLLAQSGGELVALVCADGYLPVTGDISFGKDGVILATGGQEMLQKDFDGQSVGALSVNQLLGRDIYDQRHQLIGVVGDLSFDDTTGRLAAIDVSQGLFQDLLAGRQSLGAESIAKLAAQKIVTK